MIKVYKNIETKKPYDEKSELGGIDPYSCSKSSADFAIQSYLNSYFIKKKNIKIGIARAGNVVGGGDWSKDRLIPDCVVSWSKSLKVNIRQHNFNTTLATCIRYFFRLFSFRIFFKSYDKLNHEIFNFGPNYKKIVQLEK